MQASKMYFHEQSQTLRRECAARDSEISSHRAATSPNQKTSAYSEQEQLLL